MNCDVIHYRIYSPEVIDCLVVVVVVSSHTNEPCSDDREEEVRERKSDGPLSRSLARSPSHVIHASIECSIASCLGVVRTVYMN